MAEPLRHEDFLPHVGKRFRFDGWHGALHLASIDVHAQSGMPETARTPFTLVFHGPVADLLTEGLYRTEIEDGPILEIYVIPIHTAASGRQDYQAVFN
jgi:hypothetical protein